MWRRSSRTVCAATSLLAALLQTSGCSRAHREAVWINAEVEQCPSIEGVTALPLEVLIGGEVALAAEIPEGARVHWSAPTGSFTDPDEGETLYRCEAPGEQTLTLTISEDSPCEFALDLDVTCSTNPAASASAGGNSP